MNHEDAQVATLAGGCFWCLEAVFRRMRGVDRVISGYMGGVLPDPDYEAVCSGRSGHAEVVQVHFDSHELGYDELLEVFFSIHDPTTLNRQGNDVGSQYRSAIFWHSEDQRSSAEAMIAVLDARHIWPSPIVTELAPAGNLYPAEDYHQHYYERNPGQGYCQYVVLPKVQKFLRDFPGRAKEKGR